MQALICEKSGSSPLPLLYRQRNQGPETSRDLPKVTRCWNCQPAHLTPRLVLALQMHAHCLWRELSGCVGLPFPRSTLGFPEGFWRLCPNIEEHLKGGLPGQAGGHPRSPGLGIATPASPPPCCFCSVSGRWLGRGKESQRRERAALRQQPFPGELLTKATISGTSSQTSKEGGLMTERLPLHHLHLPTSCHPCCHCLHCHHPERWCNGSCWGPGFWLWGASKEMYVHDGQGVCICRHT